MTCREAKVWERCFQLWALFFCAAMIRYSPLLGPTWGGSLHPAEPLVVAGSAWLVAGGISLSFLCRLRCLGELDDMDQGQVQTRIFASIPLGVVALIHSLYQLENRNLLNE